MGQTGSRTRPLIRNLKPRKVELATPKPGEPLQAAEQIPGPRPGSQNDVADRPPAPETKAVVEPPRGYSGWSEEGGLEPGFAQSIVGSIRTRPPDPAIRYEKFQRPLPMDRHTNVASGLVEDEKVRAGKLSISQLKEVLTLHRDGRGQVDVKGWAQSKGVDEELLEKVLKHFSLPKSESATSL